MSTMSMEFTKSPYFVPEEDNWHLKEGAPEEVVKEFEEYMEYSKELEEKGIYYQYYDESHDNGDYGERYFDEYLQKRPRSINVICDKALSRFKSDGQSTHYDRN